MSVGEIVIVSALDVELLPISQFGTMFAGKVDKTDTLDTLGDEWCDHLVSRLGNNPALLFANHGITVVGRDCKQAVHNFYALEQAMTIQLEAMKTGRKINVVPDAQVKKLQESYWGGDVTIDYDGSREWDSWVEKVLSIEPEFDAM